MQTVTLYATGDCNLRCSHCAVSVDQESHRDQLTTAELKQVLTRLAEGGTKLVTLLGGEVTIYRPDLAEILDHAAELRVGISINTNLLKWEPVERLLHCEALRLVVISLDGASAAAHDDIRGKGTFHKTVSNIERLMNSPRVKSGEIQVQTSFVMSARNVADAARIVTLAAELGVSRLNVKPVHSVGRAKTSSGQSLESRKMLDGLSKLVMTWLLVKNPPLELDVPPALAAYLNRRFGCSFPTKEGHQACGGTSIFAYVDLYGNLLPCPAKSFEENPSGGLRRRTQQFSLLDVAVEDILQTEEFITFESNRIARAQNSEMHPCNVCKFREICAPCTSDIVRGEKGVAQICAAVYECADEVPELRAELFSAPYKPVPSKVYLPVIV